MTTLPFMVNGVQGAGVAVDDRGLSFGDGLFETTAVIDGVVRFADRHVDRLLAGCSRLGIAAPDPALILDELNELANGQQRAIVKVIVTRGSGGFGYAPPADCRPTRIVMRLPWFERPVSDYRDGIDAGICTTRLARQPAVAGIKHLNRLEQVLARQEMVEKGLAEGIMLDDCDNVIEATAANVFAVCAGQLTTPRLAVSGVRGVMREVILDTAATLGIKVRRGRLELPQILDADEVFLSNCVAGVLPLRSLGHVQMRPGPVAGAIAKALGDVHIAPVGKQ